MSLEIMRNPVSTEERRSMREFVGNKSASRAISGRATDRSCPEPHWSLWVGKSDKIMAPHATLWLLDLPSRQLSEADEMKHLAVRENPVAAFPTVFPTQRPRLSRLEKECVIAN